MATVGDHPLKSRAERPDALLDSRVVSVAVPPQKAFEPIRRIGGDTGWYYANWLWRLRGAMDRLVGGAGMRRGRQDPDRLRVGDRVDFWRVEVFEPDRRLRLALELKLPGRGWLEFEVNGDGASSTIRQTAIYEPKGFFGQAYWYLLWPIHWNIWAGMLREIALAASPGPRKRPGS